jgi:hypothetical protein
MKFADTFSESRFSEDGERLTFSFPCDDMQLSYYGPLRSPFNLLTDALLTECVMKYSRTVCAMYAVQNFALVAGGFYATGRSTAIIVYHWKVKSYYCTVYHWKVNSNVCIQLEGQQQCLYTTGRSTAMFVYNWKVNRKLTVVTCSLYATIGMGTYFSFFFNGEKC